MAMRLPSFAPFPPAAWRASIAPSGWAACLDAWVALVEAHLALAEQEGSEPSESAAGFLTTFMREVAVGGAGVLGGEGAAAKALLKGSFLLTSRLVRSPAPHSGLVQWGFLADMSRVYGRKRAGSLLAGLSDQSREQLDASLTGLKKFLIKNLDKGMDGDIKAVEECLGRLDPLIHASPAVASFFLAGSDFLDGLVSCYKITNPPLGRVIVATTYLCLIGLVEGRSPNASMLADQLYTLKVAADTHKAGPLNVNDSLTAELVTATPLLQQVEHKLGASQALTSRAASVLADLAGFRKAGGLVRPKRVVRRRLDKGKSRADPSQLMAQQEIHVHRMSQISQIRDLFPELGSGFVSKLLDEYDGDPEQATAHLLDGSLPAHLEAADRSEQLSPPQEAHHSSLPPRPTPPQLPTRHNLYDADDDLSLLTADASRLHLGKRDPALTADDVLRDRAAGPGKAAILSALAAFDSDDDEHDDTYDAADVGGTVDVTAAAGAGAGAGADADAAEDDLVLFRALQRDPAAFARPARGSPARDSLRRDTGLTDEALEGWASMLARDPRRRRRLEDRAAEWTGRQAEVAATAWRAGDGEEGGGPPGGAAGGGGREAGGEGGGRGRAGGNVAGPAGERETEAARRRKEASKGSRANHNRRDQRARKMARGGFAG